MSNWSNGAEWLQVDRCRSAHVALTANLMRRGRSRLQDRWLTPWTLHYDVLPREGCRLRNDEDLLRHLLHLLHHPDLMSVGDILNVLRREFDYLFLIEDREGMRMRWKGCSSGLYFYCYLASSHLRPLTETLFLLQLLDEAALDVCFMLYSFFFSFFVWWGRLLLFVLSLFSILNRFICFLMVLGVLLVKFCALLCLRLLRNALRPCFCLDLLCGKALLSCHSLTQGLELVFQLLYDSVETVYFLKIGS